MKVGKAYWITAVSLLVGGSVVAAVGYSVAAKDSNKATFTEKFEKVSSIDFDLNGCELNIVSSDSAKEITVDVNEVAGDFNNRIDGDKLIISNKSKFRLHIFTPDYFKEPGTVTVTVPAIEYDSLKFDLNAIKNGKIEDLTVNSIDIDLDAADVDFTNIKVLGESKKFNMDACDVTMSYCEFPTLFLDVSAYDLDLDNCKVNGEFILDGSAGDCTMRSCFFENMNIDHSAGSFAMKDCYLKGDMDLETSAGSSTIGLIGNKNDYNVHGSVSAGGIYVDGAAGTYANSDASHSIHVSCSAGDVRVNFTEPME